MSELHPEWVTITHSDPGVEDAQVPASAAPLWRNSGWQVAGGQDAQVEELPAEAQRFEGQPQVRIYHPELDRYETVAESAVPQHRSQGWLLAADAETAQYDGATVEALRAIAGRRGLKKSGTKDELIARLRGEGQDTEEAGEPAPSEEDEG